MKLDIFQLRTHGTWWWRPKRCLVRSTLGSCPTESTCLERTDGTEVWIPQHLRARSRQQDKLDEAGLMKSLIRRNEQSNRMMVSPKWKKNSFRRRISSVDPIFSNGWY